MWAGGPRSLESEDLLDGFEAAGGGGVTQTCGGGADGEVETFPVIPVLVDAVEEAGGEGVAGAVGALDVTGGEIE